MSHGADDQQQGHHHNQGMGGGMGNVPGMPGADDPAGDMRGRANENEQENEAPEANGEMHGGHGGRVAGADDPAGDDHGVDAAGHM